MPTKRSMLLPSAHTDVSSQPPTQGTKLVPFSSSAGDPSSSELITITEMSRSSLDASKGGDRKNDGNGS